jgi:uncharacterized protein (TIRG00374 family)
MLLAVVVLGWVLPSLIGTTVGSVLSSLRPVSPLTLVGLTLIWMAGIYVHSFVLTGALPGLKRRQALTLNLTGSAVANVLPFGGATAMALNHHMIRTWGMNGTAFASYTLITNIWVVLLKLVTPLVALVALLVGGVPISHRTTVEALLATGGFLTFLSLGALLLLHRPVAERVGLAVGRALSWASGWRARPWSATRIATAVLGCRDTVAAVVSTRAGQLSAGMLGYGALQATLLWACLGAVGLHVSIPIVLAAFAADRVMTLVVVTPGGLGFAELGATATLVGLGLPPAPAAAAVLLYRGFTYAAEIPVGGAWLAGWLWTTRRRGIRP